MKDTILAIFMAVLITLIVSCIVYLFIPKSINTKEAKFINYSFTINLGE